ncbi:hypothetical protein KSP40_PGU000576 [Platanthera guangdongensis]|uniref:Uncharacterized protein n=1 Tax=Platanthera guangdongensis TaxID=2320717 RepID=A0ABR2MEC4_9ASPA
MSYYTGKDDPIQHLQWFENVVDIKYISDAFKCRLFAITLKGKEKDWFHRSHPDQSIASSTYIRVSSYVSQHPRRGRRGRIHFSW